MVNCLQWFVVCSTLLSQVINRPDRYLFKLVSTKNVHSLIYVASYFQLRLVFVFLIIICSFGLALALLIYVHLTNFENNFIHPRGEKNL